MPQGFQIIPLWEVRATSDESGQPTTLEGYTPTKEEADAFAVGKGWYGGKGVVTPVWGLKIDGMVFALAQPEPVNFPEVKKKQEDADAVRRAKLLKELSADDLRILGVKP